MRLHPALLLLLPLALPASAQLPPFPADGLTLTIPYAAPAPDFHHLTTLLKVSASINGGPTHAFTVDTGSVGIVVPASEVPDIDPAAKPGTLRYVSSGLTLKGVWTMATVRFPNSTLGGAVEGTTGKKELPGGSDLAEARVPVLAVSSSTCEGGSSNSARCVPGNIPHMLGVGFGRGTGDGMATPAANPFLNLPPMLDHRMIPGYVIAPGGITLGLNKLVTQGFVLGKLSRPAGHNCIPIVKNSPKAEAKAATRPIPIPSDPACQDWDTPAATISIAGKTLPPATALLDTGLTNLTIASPEGTPGAEIPAGTSITIAFLSGQLTYTFKVGDEPDPMTPRRASYLRVTHGPFVNTGLHALACFDYLYDALDGTVGLRPTCKR